jgi:hypothetical protein
MDNDDWHHAFVSPVSQIYHPDLLLRQQEEAIQKSLSLSMTRPFRVLSRPKRAYLYMTSPAFGGGDKQKGAGPNHGSPLINSPARRAATTVRDIGTRNESPSRKRL